MRPESGFEQPILSMAGEALLMVEFGKELSIDLGNAVLAFDEHLQSHLPSGVIETAPTGLCVAVRFDPLLIAPDELRREMAELAGSADWFSKGARLTPRRWRLPVLYGGEAGPDLAGLAQRVGQPVDAVIEAHVSTVQRVFMIGFAPGFLYTGLLPPLFDLPRLAHVKPRVPAGSVSVAIGQSVISSTAHPTGWHTIGRTPFVNFDPDREPPVLIRAGDEIEFYAIDHAERPL